MNEYSKAILELSKMCVVKRLTASGMVTSKPCYVFFISACPDNGGLVYEGALHNGETSSEEILYDIKGLYGQNKANPSLPLYFNKGLYAAITANLESIIVQFCEDPYR